MDTNSFNSAGFVSQGFLNPAIINQNSDNIQSQQLQPNKAFTSSSAKKNVKMEQEAEAGAKLA